MWAGCETIDADASELTVRYPSGERGFDGREGCLGWGELGHRCLAYACTSQEPRQRYPARGDPCSPSLRDWLFSRIWCTPASPVAAARVVVVGAESLAGGEEHLSRPAYTKLGSGSGEQWHGIMSDSLCLVCAAISIIP